MGDLYKPPSPTHILITGASGFIGQDLVAALIKTSPHIRLTLTDIVRPPVPSSIAHHANWITTVKCDLTDPSVVASLLHQRYDAVYLLHGLMSGGAEANLELGWRVNWDSHRGVIDYLRRNHEGTRVVFPSSLAVYGPPKHDGGVNGLNGVNGTNGEVNGEGLGAGVAVTSEETSPQPQSSYGAQKLMVETYLNDMSRRGLLDARIVRLPTIIVRPGAPSAAASSFCSGIVREPVKGIPTTLPVSRDLELWVCSPETVVENLVRIKDVPGEHFGKSRVVNLPGITVTSGEILKALGEVQGEDVLKLVSEERDPKIEAIVGSWPARFDTGKANGLGMKGDVSLTENIRLFVERQTGAKVVNGSS